MYLNSFLIPIKQYISDLSILYHKYLIQRLLLAFPIFHYKKKMNPSKQSIAITLVNKSIVQKLCGIMFLINQYLLF